MTVFAALMIGVFQNELANVSGRWTWLPDVGTPDALPFAVIIVVMFVVGKSLPERGAAVEGRLQSVPKSRRRIVRPVVLVTATVVALYVVSASYRLALINTMIGAIVCLSLVVITGYVAQISLFQATLAGVAAYMLAGFTTGIGVPFPIAPLLACLGATAIGLIAALPALRVRGINLAVITLAGGFAIQQLVFNNPDYTGGFEGATVSSPHFFGTLLSFSKGRTIGQPVFGVFVLVVLTLVALGGFQPPPQRHRSPAPVRADERAGGRVDGRQHGADEVRRLRNLLVHRRAGRMPDLVPADAHLRLVLQRTRLDRRSSPLPSWAGSRRSPARSSAACCGPAA